MNNLDKNSSVYVVIVTYNAINWLSFFGEEFKIIPEKWKIIVVDNASTDNTCTLIEKKYPHFILIKSPTNLGFGRANNIGLKLALQEGADHAFLLNQDAKISVKHIQQLVAIQHANPHFFILSPIHLNGSGTDMDIGFASYCRPPECPHLYSDAIKGEMKTVYESSLGNAAAWLLSRKCLLTIGGFNPLFTHYGEDDEYRNRVRYHGYKLGIAPSTIAFHDRENRTPQHPLANLKPVILVQILQLDDRVSFFSLSKQLGIMCIKKLCKLKIYDFLFIMKVFFFLVRGKNEIMHIKKVLRTVAPHFLLASEHTLSNQSFYQE